MKSRKLLITGIALLAFIGFAGALYAFPFGNSGTRGQMAGDLDRRRTTIRSTKILQFNIIGSESIYLHRMEEMDEILAETAIIAHGLSSSNATDGTWGLLIDDTSTTLPAPLIINVAEFGTQQFHFDPPLPIEAGNTLIFQRSDGATENFYSSITFHGTEPPASGVIMR